MLLGRSQHGPLSYHPFSYGAAGCHALSYRALRMLQAVLLDHYRLSCIARRTIDQSQYATLGYHALSYRVPSTTHITPPLVTMPLVAMRHQPVAARRPLHASMHTPASLAFRWCGDPGGVDSVGVA